MKTHFSDVEYADRKAQELQTLSNFPPSIPFAKPKDKKVEDKAAKKDKFKTFYVKIDNTEEDADTIEYSIMVFEEGTPEVYLRWLERILRNWKKPFLE